MDFILIPETPIDDTLKRNEQTMLLINDQQINNKPEIKRFFTDTNAAGFYEWNDWSAEKGLERLVFHVSRKPKNLQAHLERIYYCFQEKLNEQLFGAIIDLSLILNNNGSALLKRIILGSKSQLTDEQYQVLINPANIPEESNKLMLENRYSVFTKGLQSFVPLVAITVETDTNEPDPIGLARDYIEFSQIDNAIDILERAILLNPERKALHDELLTLYRSTKNQTRFNRFYMELMQAEITLPVDWQVLNNEFKNLQ